METANTAGRGYFIQKKNYVQVHSDQKLIPAPSNEHVITLKSVQNQRFSDLLLFCKYLCMTNRSWRRLKKLWFGQIIYGSGFMGIRPNKKVGCG